MKKKMKSKIFLILEEWEPNRMSVLLRGLIWKNAITPVTVRLINVYFSSMSSSSSRNLNIRARARAHARRHYLAGYLLRSEPSAPTWFRCSRNPAVAEPPRSVSKPMLRLEERSLEKLLAMVESGRTGGGTGGPDTRIKSF